MLVPLCFNFVSNQVQYRSLFQYVPAGGTYAGKLIAAHISRLHTYKEAAVRHHSKSSCLHSLDHWIQFISHMENMLHLTPAHRTLPNGFSLGPERLPPAITSTVVTLPVIDMSHSREEVRQAMLDAGKEFGFFQVSKNFEQLISIVCCRACMQSLSIRTCI
jgi:hypothetical protein